MPFDKILAQQHEAQARHNYALFNQLRTNENYSDWLVTLLFYTVLHLAQAHLVEVSTSGFDIPKGHPQRACYIARKLSEIYANYRFLETRSSWARHHPERSKPTLSEVQSYHDQAFTQIADALAEKGISLLP